MHPDTKALLLAAIRAEVQADADRPSPIGYANKSAAEIAALMNAPVVVAQPATHRDVSISDVRGYLEARLVLVRLEDWIADPATPKGSARDAARTLLRVTSAPGLADFKTKTEGGRANILGLFALLVSAGAGGLTQTHYNEIAAMTLAPAGPPVVEPARWGAVIDGISAAATPAEPIGQTEDGKPIPHPGYAGPPNAATEALVQEAINGGG
jgi:hypothetical protein